MIKLVVSDIDGTLVPEGTDDVNPELYEVIRALVRRGIVFAGASGRQYESMYHVLGPVAEDIYFIAENGTNVVYRGETIRFVPIGKELADEVIAFVRAQKGCRIIVSVPETMYTEGDDERFLDWLRNGYHNKVEVTEDVGVGSARANKISLYHPTDAEALSREAKRLFGDRIAVTLAGAAWVDFTAKGTDKGEAVARLQQELGIGKEETMAFGDNCNDIGMLLQAGESYAVSNAHPKLRETAKYEARPCTENGVLQVLEERILRGETT